MERYCLAPLANKLIEETMVEYQPHRPEQTLFYQTIEQHYPSFMADWRNNIKVIMKDGKIFKNTL